MIGPSTFAAQDTCVRRWGHLLVGGLLALATLGGCSAVLSKPQIAAVHTFSSVATVYPRLPASVLVAYGDVHASRTMFRASVALSANAADSIAKMHASIATHETVTEAAEQLTAGLEVLDRYCSALRTLSSDAQLDDLDATVASFGKGIDAGITALNVHLSSADKVPTFGGATAAAIRAAGGIVVRNRQEAYLRQFVVEADPALDKLTLLLSAVLSQYFDPSRPGHGLLPNDRNSLDEAFLTYCALQKGPLRASDIAVFYRAIAAETAAEELVASTIRATERLRSVHHTLVAATSPKANVAALRDEIEALAKELVAAAKAKAAVTD